MAIERPKYTVEFEAKPCEVREYPPSVAATVHVDGDRSDAVNVGFRILAGYIFGDNQAHQKISMTAPVTQSTGQSKEMVPTGSDIRFIMPAQYTLSTLPVPRDSRISLVQVPASRMASITFSGFWSDANFQSHRDQLFDFLQRYQLSAVSPPKYAYYNPPWTPWFMRTNEVLVEIRGERH